MNVRNQNYLELEATDRNAVLCVRYLLADSDFQMHFLVLLGFMVVALRGERVQK